MLRDINYSVFLLTLCRFVSPDSLLFAEAVYAARWGAECGFKLSSTDVKNPLFIGMKNFREIFPEQRY